MAAKISNIVVLLVCAICGRKSRNPIECFDPQRTMHTVEAVRRDRAHTVLCHRQHNALACAHKFWGCNIQPSTPICIEQFLPRPHLYQFPSSFSLVYRTLPSTFSVFDAFLRPTRPIFSILLLSCVLASSNYLSSPSIRHLLIATRYILRVMKSDLL